MIDRAKDNGVALVVGSGDGIARLSPDASHTGLCRLLREVEKG